MISESVLQCTSDEGSNLAEGKMKNYHVCMCVIHVVIFVGCLSPKPVSIVPQRLRYEDWSSQDVSEWLSSNSINNIPVKM
jgi:hypothetical protein